MADLTKYKCYKNNKYQVLTNDGFRDFRGLIVGSNTSKIELILSNNKTLICTPKHKLLTEGEVVVYAEGLVVGDRLYGGISVISVKQYENERKVYELLEVEKTHTYYANGVLSKQCLIIDEMAFIECVAGDTIIHLKHKLSSEEISINIAHILLSLNEESAHISDDIISFSHNEEYQILTEEGWRDFKGVAKYNKKPLLHIGLEGGKSIYVSPNHEFIGEHDTVLAKDCLGVRIRTIDGIKSVIHVSQEHEDYVYDCVGVDGTSSYYTNGILSHNTHLVEEFWKSVFPVITSSKTSKVFICSTANGTDNLFYKIFDGAEKGENGWAYDVVKWHEVPGRDEEWANNTKQALGSLEGWLQEFESCGAETIINIDGEGEIQIGEMFDRMEE